MVLIMAVVVAVVIGGGGGGGKAGCMGIYRVQGNQLVDPTES